MNHWSQLTLTRRALAASRASNDCSAHNCGSGHRRKNVFASIKKIVRTLRPLQQINVRIAGHEHLAEDPITPTAQTILDNLDC